MSPHCPQEGPGTQGHHELVPASSPAFTPVFPLHETLVPATTHNESLSPRPSRHKHAGIPSSLILSIFFSQSHTCPCTHVCTCTPPHTHMHISCPCLHPPAPRTLPHHHMSRSASSLSVCALSPPRLRLSGQGPHQLLSDSLETPQGQTRSGGF